MSEEVTSHSERAHALNRFALRLLGTVAYLVLAALRPVLPETELYGFDIAPAAARFWERHAPARIHFELGDFFEVSQRCYDIVLVLDVDDLLLRGQAVKAEEDAGLFG